jgi:hypothetical protein
LCKKNLGVSTNLGWKIPLSDQILRYVGGNCSKIATVSTAGNGKRINELGILAQRKCVTI